MDPLEFLELCSIGDWKEIREVLENRLVDVNYQHKINGWTGLHWASRRGHKTVVQLLLKYGADPNLVDSQGRSPADVASDQEIIDLLGGPTQKAEAASAPTVPELPFVPNYLQNPSMFQRKKRVNARSHANDNSDNTSNAVSMSTVLISVGAVAAGVALLSFLLRHFRE